MVTGSRSKKTQRATKQVRCQSFVIRSVNDWNNLPVEVVEVNSVNEFKNVLDKYWRERRYVHRLCSTTALAFPFAEIYLSLSYEM